MKDGVHIRLTLTRGVKITSGMDPRLNQSGPTLIVLAEHKAPGLFEGGPQASITSSQRRSPPDCLDPKIHHANLLSSILAKIQANAAGADDAIMLDVRGFVAETNATHLFIVHEGIAWRTPTLAACPEGITRATVLDICRAEKIPCEVRDLSLTEFYRADEVFCTGTMGELAGVTQVDGQQDRRWRHRADDRAPVVAVREAHGSRRHARRRLSSARPATVRNLVVAACVLALAGCADVHCGCSRRRRPSPCPRGPAIRRGRRIAPRSGCAIRPSTAAIGRDASIARHSVS